MRGDPTRLTGGSRIARFLGAAIALLGIGATPGYAAEEPLLARIDFEDRETATADWSHVFEQAPGLPRRNLFFDAVVDESVAAGGGSSLRLDLEGGSISYRMLPEAAVPVPRDADFRVSARVMTQSLRHASARLEIRIVDGRRLDERRGESEDPVADATILLAHAVADGDVGATDRQWTELATMVRTDGERFDGLDDLRLFVALQVVQPGHRGRADAEPELFPTVRLEDIDGRAWFDDIEVRRSPRLRISSLAPSGIVRTTDPIPFDAVVDDPIGSVGGASVELRNLDGQVVDRRTLAIEDGPRHRIELRPGDPGWFEVALIVTDVEGTRSLRRHAVVVLPGESNAGGRQAPRFGVSVSGWTPETLDELESALGALDPDAVELPLWPRSNDERASLEGVEGVKRLLDRQRRAGREPMLAINRLHGGLAATARVEPHAIAAALRDDSDGVWRRAIGDWMLRLGTAISRWRVDLDGLQGPPTMLTELAASLVADPILLVGHPFEARRDPMPGDEPCLLGDADLSSRAQEQLAGDSIDGGTVVLSPPPVDWTARDRVDAAARRGLVAWNAGAARILTHWDHTAPPDPAIVAWTGLARGIGARRPAGALRVSPTATCLIADDARGTVLVAWSDLARDRETIQLPVGVDEVELLELDGRRSRVGTSEGILRLEVGGTPRFVLGVDRLSTLVASSTRFQPDALSVGTREHQVDLLVRNPIPAPIDGRLRIDPPPGWTIEPSRPMVQAAAGETVRVPLVISWSGARVLGRKTIPMRLDVRSPRSLQIPMEVPIELRSDALVIDADWTIAQGGSSDSAPIIASVEIENVGDRVLDLEVMVSAWRVGREGRLVTNLRPGDRVTRRVPVRAGIDRLAGTDLRIEVRELDGPESVATRVPLIGGDRKSVDAAVVEP